MLLYEFLDTDKTLCPASAYSSLCYSISFYKYAILTLYAVSVDFHRYMYDYALWKIASSTLIVHNQLHQLNSPFEPYRMIILLECIMTNNARYLHNHHYIHHFLDAFDEGSSIYNVRKGTKQCVDTMRYHYNDVIMSAMASQITSLTIVYSTVYPGADQRKHQSSAALAVVRGIHRWPMNSSHKGPVTRKMFPFDDVIMITECCEHINGILQLQASYLVYVHTPLAALLHSDITALTCLAWFTYKTTYTNRITTNAITNSVHQIILNG